MIRLLNPLLPLHLNALNYYKHFLEKGIKMKFSTISIGEYTVKDNIESLPFLNFQVLPFNIDHAIRAGAFANILFQIRKTENTSQKISIERYLIEMPRNIISNDVKLFAQADIDKSINAFVTSDSKSKRFLTDIKSCNPKFRIIDISIPLSVTIGELPFLEMSIV